MPGASDKGKERATDMDLQREAFVEMCKTLILRYLEGTGHPDHPNTRAIVPPEEFEQHRKNKLLRASSFLKAISGSDLRNANPKWKATVRDCSC